MDHTHEESEFIQHEPCPKCGSRDNLARYDDGHAFCFGCNYREKADGGAEGTFVPALSPWRTSLTYHWLHGPD